MARRELAVFFHHLQGERRRRQRQRRASKQRRLPPRSEEYQRDETQSHRRQGNLRSTETEDGLPHRPQSFRPEFEPDQKEQQNDAELRKMQNLLGIALGEQGSDAKGSKQNAGHQVAENRGYSEPARQWRRQRESRQKNGQFVESHSVPRLVMGLTRTVILH